MFKLKSKFQKIVFITIALGASVVSFSQQRPPNPVPCFGIGVGVCEQAQENTYYVSTSGDNEAAGGFNSPWRTLNHAISQVSPGDTILVANGTYEGFRNFNYSGEEGSPITLKANGTSVILDRGLSGNRDIIELNGVSHFVVDGFEIRNASRAGIAIIDTDYISIRNNDIGPNQIWGILTGFATHLEILNNRTFDSSEQHGIYVSNSRVANDNAIIKGNVVYGNHQNGIQVNGDCEVGGDGVITDSIIEGNRVYDNGWKGLSLISFADSIVRNNIIYDNGQRGGAGGIHLTNQPNCNQPSNNNAVYNNTIYEPNIAAVRITDDARDNKLFNNIAVSSNTFADEVGANQIDSTSNIGRSSPSGLFLDFDNRNFELSATSAALNTGRESYSGVTVSSFDYRGSFRPNGGSIDVGAVEVITGSNVVDNSSGGGDTMDPLVDSGSGGSTGGDDTSGSTGVVDTGGSTGSDDTVVNNTDDSLTFQNSKGYIYLNDTVINELSEKLSSGDQRALKFVDTVTTQMNGRNYYGFESWNAALLSVITEDESYCQYAVNHVDEFIYSEELIIEQYVASGGSSAYPHAQRNNYLYTGDTILDIGFVHNWCSNIITVSQSSRWASYVNSLLFNVWNPELANWDGVSTRATGWAINDPANNFYFSFLQGTMIAGLFQRSIDPVQSQLWINKFQEKSAAVIEEFQGMSGGGSREGTGYGQTLRHLFMTFHIWEQTTGEDLHSQISHPKDSLSYMMHSTVPTGTHYVPFGDQSGWGEAPFFDIHRIFLLTLADIYRGSDDARIASTYLKNRVIDQVGNPNTHVYDFLFSYDEPSGLPISNLPLYHHADGAGHYFSRSGWGVNDSLLAMTFGSRTQSHDHGDKGSFHIFKNDWLAYNQNINFSPSLQQGSEYGNLVRFNAPGIIEQPINANNPTLHHLEDDGETLHIAIESADFYQNDALETNWREIIYLRPGVVVVYDQIVTQSGVTKTWQLNSPYRPEISNGVAVFSAPSSTMRVHMLLPDNAVNSVFDWSSRGGTIERYIDSAGNSSRGFRLDRVVSDSSTEFLNVIDVDDSVSSVNVSEVGNLKTLNISYNNGQSEAITLNGCCVPSSI